MSNSIIEGLGEGLACILVLILIGLTYYVKEFFVKFYKKHRIKILKIFKIITSPIAYVIGFIVGLHYDSPRKIGNQLAQKWINY